MSRLYEKIFGSTVDHPVWVFVVLCLLTGVSIMGQVNPRWWSELLAGNTAEVSEETQQPAAPSAQSPPDQTPSAPAETAPATPPPPRRSAPDVQAVSLTNSDVVLVIDSDDFFTPEGAKALRAIAQALENFDAVQEVFWLDRVPVLNIFGLRESLLPGERASARQFEMAREKATAHPLVGGQMLSEDGQTLLMLIKLDWLFVTSDADCTARIKEIAQETMQDFPELEFSFLMTGKVPMYLTFINSQTQNRWKYQAIGYGMTALMAFLLFRGLRAVLIVTAAACLGVFWTVGILHYFDLQDNPFNDIVLPVLLSLIALTDGVHLLVEIRRQRARGLSEREAARKGVIVVGLACVLTSITTAIGFGSLATAHHDIVREFGWSCVLGVLLTFLSVIMVVPLACSSFLGRNLHVDLEKGLIERQLNRIEGVIKYILIYRRGISRVAIVSTVVLIGISLQLRPDERRANALPVSSEVSRTIAHLDQAMGGMEHSSVRIHWSEEIPDHSPEILETIMAVDDLLREHELIGQPLSLRNFVDVLPGTGSPAERMPLVELLPAELKRAFYEPEKRQAVVDFRVQDLGIAKYGPIFTALETGLQQLQTERPGFTVELRGAAATRWKDLYQIVVDLALSLGSASVIIFLVLTIAYRSIKLGIISLVPNFFPLALTGTFLVFTGQSLELASVCAFTVCLGIAVDDTIHFLTRFQEELSEHSIQKAISEAFYKVGTAMIMTTLILVIGFATVLFSDMRHQQIFATMGILTIGSALFADLIFLPALLAYYLKDKPEAGHITDPAQKTEALSQTTPVS